MQHVKMQKSDFPNSGIIINQIASDFCDLNRRHTHLKCFFPFLKNIFKLQTIFTFVYICQYIFIFTVKIILHSFVYYFFHNMYFPFLLKMYSITFLILLEQQYRYTIFVFSLKTKSPKFLTFQFSRKFRPGFHGQTPSGYCVLVHCEQGVVRLSHILFPGLKDFIVILPAFDLHLFQEPEIALCYYYL